MVTPAPAWTDLRGHGPTLQRLERALDRGQLHHALLFVGPKGVGKATVARALAKALHCSVAPGRGCGHCSSCHRIDEGLHGGVEWIVPESEGAHLKVEQARELAARLQHAPFDGPVHMVIFDPAQALTDQSYNALLKTLEEPQPGVHFILIAEALDAILPTILSRAAVLRFGRLDDADVAQVLAQTMAATPSVAAPVPTGKSRKTRASEAAPEPIPAARAELAVALADGSAGIAVQLAQDPSVDAILELVRAAAQGALAGPKSLFAGDHGPVAPALAAATAGPATGKPARERAAVIRMAELWLLHLRDRLRDRPGLPDLPDLGPDPIAWRRAAQLLMGLVTRLDRNANAKLVLDQTLLQLGDLAAPAHARP